MSAEIRAEYVGEGKGCKPREDPVICVQLNWLAAALTVYAFIWGGDRSPILVAVAAFVGFTSLVISFAALGEKSVD